MTHIMGLTCHPVSAATAEESYCVEVMTVGSSGIHVRGYVWWQQPCMIDRPRGHAIWEALTRWCPVDSEKRMDAFLAILPGLWKGFERGLRRGHPPSTLTSWWNRLWDIVGTS